MKKYWAHSYTTDNLDVIDIQNIVHKAVLSGHNVRTDGTIHEGEHNTKPLENVLCRRSLGVLIGDKMIYCDIITRQYDNGPGTVYVVRQ